MVKLMGDREPYPPLSGVPMSVTRRNHCKNSDYVHFGPA